MTTKGNLKYSLWQPADCGGRGNDIAYHWTFIECLLRTSSKKDVGIGGSHQKLNAHFTCSSKHKLKRDLYQLSHMISPDRFRWCPVVAERKLSKEEMDGSSGAAQTVAAMWGWGQLQNDIPYFRYYDQFYPRLVASHSIDSDIPHVTGTWLPIQDGESRPPMRDVITACNNFDPCACVKHLT